MGDIMNNLITILNFSARANGNCAAISRFVEDYYKYAITRTYTVNNIIAPCRNCNYSCLKVGEQCPEITKEYKELMETLMQSQLIFFIVPNFCGFPCSNYFTFNERTVGYFNKSKERMESYMNIPKRFIIISNTESEVFTEAMAQQTFCKPDILYLKTSRYRKRSIDGDLLDSTEAKDELDKFLAQKHF